jgi:dipeptide/tripeptide permease
MFLHGCNLIFGALIAGTLTKSGFWFALRWSGFSDMGVWLAAFGCIIVLLGIGILAAPAFLFSCDSISLMEYQNRKKMLAATVIYPWLFGSLLILLLKFPDLHFLETYQHFTLLLMLLPVYFLNQQNLFSETVEMPKRTRLAQMALILLVLLALAFRVLLQNGRFFG